MQLLVEFLLSLLAPFLLLRLGDELATLDILQVTAEFLPDALQLLSQEILFLLFVYRLLSAVTYLVLEFQILQLTAEDA